MASRPYNLAARAGLTPRKQSTVAGLPRLGLLGTQGNMFRSTWRTARSASPRASSWVLCLSGGFGENGEFDLADIRMGRSRPGLHSSKTSTCSLPRGGRCPRTLPFAARVAQGSTPPCKTLDTPPTIYEVQSRPRRPRLPARTRLL
jgi:hypothetical protein